MNCYYYELLVEDQIGFCILESYLYDKSSDSIILLMQGDKVCLRIAIKSEKERELFRKREEKHIEGTPRVVLGKSEPALQEIWIDDVKN